MKTIVLRGPVLTQSGYGVHARQVARWLLSKQSPELDVKFTALPWGDTPWIIDHGQHGGFIGELMQRAVPLATKCDVSVQLQLPNEWDPSAAATNIGITAGVETDRCNPEWVDACNRMQAVVVPSIHSRRCLQAGGDIKVPVHVVPEAFSDAVRAPAPTDVELPIDTKFNFLVFGQLTGNNPDNDRKNIFYTIKWLAEAFSDDPDVGIIIKTNSGRNSRIDRQVTTALVGSAIKESRRGLDKPRFCLVHGDMTDDEVVGLYRHRTVKALVSLTRGEGFGLPLLEAAASGLPVIATGWSGHTDFLGLGKYISVYYKLDEVHASRVDNRIFVKGARWATPSEEDFKKKVVKFKDRPEVPKQWAAELSAKLVATHSFEAISRRLDAAIGGMVVP